MWVTVVSGDLSCHWSNHGHYDTVTRGRRPHNRWLMWITPCDGFGWKKATNTTQQPHYLKNINVIAFLISKPEVSKIDDIAAKICCYSSYLFVFRVVLSALHKRQKGYGSEDSPTRQCRLHLACLTAVMPSRYVQKQWATRSIMTLEPTSRL